MGQHFRRGALALASSLEDATWRQAYFTPTIAAVPEDGKGLFLSLSLRGQVDSEE